MFTLFKSIDIRMSVGLCCEFRVREVSVQKECLSFENQWVFLQPLRNNVDGQTIVCWLSVTIIIIIVSTDKTEEEVQFDEFESKKE